ncbi:MAG: hypothetical protein WAK29_05605 [Terriglobales bacterium]
MSRVALILVDCLLVAIAAAQDVPQASSVGRHISDLHTVCLTNSNADQIVFEKLKANVRQWGRWKIVGKPEQADVLLVLSETIETSTQLFDPSPSFGSNVFYLVWPTSTIEVDTFTLVGVDRTTGRQLSTLHCERHHLPAPSQWLVSHLRKKIEERERMGE